MNIKIKEEDFKLKKTIRTYFIFEQLAERQFDNSKMMDIYLLFYSMLLANNQETFTYTFDEFIDICDDDTSIFEQFNDYLITINNIDNQFNKEEEDTEKKKMKK